MKTLAQIVFEMIKSGKHDALIFYAQSYNKTSQSDDELLKVITSTLDNLDKLCQCHKCNNYMAYEDSTWAHECAMDDYLPFGCDCNILLCEKCANEVESGRSQDYWIYDGEFDEGLDDDTSDS